MITNDLTDVAELLRNGVTSGTGSARAALGEGATFADITGAITTIANYAEHLRSAGMSFPVTTASESGTPATVVAERGTKPTAVQLQQTTQALKKFAGLATVSLEEALTTDAVLGAVMAVLNGSVLRAFEADATATVVTGAGSNVPTPASWIAGLAEAQALIVGAGGTPSVLAISASDWAGFVGDVLGTTAFVSSPESPVGTVLGSIVHVSPNMTPGTAVCFDRAAVQVVSHEASPLAISDGVSLADSNQMRLVLDLVAATFVSAPSKVASITAPTP